MLYDLSAGVNASPHASPSWESRLAKSVPPYKETREGYPETKTPDVSLSGLAATVPHRANVSSKIPGGGGGIGPAGTGGEGGGDPPPGEQSIAITFGSTFRPLGRNVSPFTPAPGIATTRQMSVPRRVAYQASSQGARVSRGEATTPLTRGSSFPTGGLFGFSPGLHGFFDDLGGGLKRAFTPPRAVRQALSKPLRYTGAFLTAAVLPAGTRRKAFGLSPRESSQFEVIGKVQRGVALTLTGVAAAKALSAKVAAAKAAKAAALSKPAFAAPAGKLTLFTAKAATPTFAPAGYAAPGAFGAVTPAASTASLALGPVVAPAQVGLVSASQIATPAQIAASAPLAAPVAPAASAAKSGGFLASFSKAAGTTIGTTAPLILMSGLSKGSPGGLVMQEEGGYAPMPENPVVIGPPPGELPYYGESGGGSSGSSEVPIEAGMSLPMMIVLGGVAATAAVMIFRGKK